MTGTNGLKFGAPDPLHYFTARYDRGEAITFRSERKDMAEARKHAKSVGDCDNRTVVEVRVATPGEAEACDSRIRANCQRLRYG